MSVVFQGSDTREKPTLSLTRPARSMEVQGWGGVGKEAECRGEAAPATPNPQGKVMSLRGLW